jgi:hypothetical protein
VDFDAECVSDSMNEVLAETGILDHGSGRAIDIGSALCWRADKRPAPDFGLWVASIGFRLR